MASRPGHLRPRSLAEILDGAVRHYRSRFLSLVLPFVPFAVVQVIGALALVGFLSFLMTLGDEIPEDFDPRAMFQWIGFSILFALFGFLALVPGFGAAVLMTGSDLVGRTLLAGQAWRQASGRFWGIVGVGLSLGMAHLVAVVLATLLLAVSAVAGPLILILFPLAMIPNAWVWIVFSLAAHAYLLEGGGVFDSLGRSRELVRGNFWRGAGLLAFVAALNMALGTLSSAAQYAAPLFMDQEGEATAAFTVVLGLSSVLGILVNLFLMPLYTLVYTHFYWDLRVRKEGLDLHTKLSRLEESPS